MAIFNKVVISVYIHFINGNVISAIFQIAYGGWNSGRKRTRDGTFDSRATEREFSPFPTSWIHGIPWMRNVILRTADGKLYISIAFRSNKRRGETTRHLAWVSEQHDGKQYLWLAEKRELFVSQRNAEPLSHSSAAEANGILRNSGNLRNFFSFHRNFVDIQINNSYVRIINVG